MDDVRVGRLIRALRLRLGWRQVDLAARAGVSQQEVSVLERGHFQGVPLRIVRAVLRALDASTELDVRWRGGAIDRLLDERHARLVEAAAGTLQSSGWQTLLEVTYSIYGERGSVDLLGWKAGDGAIVVGEVKSDLTSVEQTQRKHDEKVRLAPRIARDRLGFAPRVVGRLLVLPEGSTSRRRVERARDLLARSYPLATREVRHWLVRPTVSMGGVLFLPDTIPSSVGRGIVRPRDEGPSRPFASSSPSTTRDGE